MFSVLTMTDNTVLLERRKIINQSELQSSSRRTAAKLTMLIGSAATLYFLVVLTAALWLVGVPYGYRHLLGRDGGRQTVNMVKVVAVLAAVSFVTLVGWAEYNKIVFGKLTRRKLPLPVSVEEMASVYHIKPENVREMQQAKQAVL